MPLRLCTFCSPLRSCFFIVLNSRAGNSICPLTWWLLPAFGCSTGSVWGACRVMQFSATGIQSCYFRCCTKEAERFALVFAIGG
jgi:hypothetical protein